MKDLMNTVRTLAWAALIAAIYQELRKPPAERTWHGKVGGVIPYDFRIPSVERVRAAYWDPDSDRVFTDQVLGPLIEYDQRHHADFVHTLARFLAHNGNLQATARELNLHVNSVTYRMQRIQAIACLDLEQAEDRLLAQVALKILTGVVQM